MKIQNNPEVLQNSNLTNSSFLSIGIVLIGVFIIVNSLSSLIIELLDLIQAILNGGRLSFQWYAFIPICLGLILIAKNKKIVQLINN